MNSTFLFNDKIHDLVSRIDILRFLWVENISKKDRIVVYRFLRVVCGVTASPFLLGATIKSHVTKIYCHSNCSGSFEKIIARYAC